MLFGTPDIARWGDVENLDRAWDERTRLIAGLIPKDSRVLEFGAGRRLLERYLDPTCVYIASDLVDRGPGTMVCDLNARPLPDLSGLRPDVAVFGGVLEYIARLESIPPWLARHVSTCVASYECAAVTGRARRLRERWVRAGIGWVNAYTEDELLALFAASGFTASDTVIWHTPEGDEPIFVFKRLPLDPSRFR
jgi:hypothetical protein